MKIAFFSSEVVPFAKTGGLADVAGSLPIALEKQGVEVAVIMPCYHTIKTNQNPVTIAQNVKVFFVGHPSYFSREGLYGDRYGDYPDNLERFSFFCKESLELLKRIRFQADCLHCHDWQTALIPVYLETLYREDPFFAKTKTMITVHNLAYQGIFSKDQFPKTGLGWEYFNIEGLEFYDQVNLLKGGLNFSDRITTVSPTYAREIQTPESGHGLDGVLREHKDQLVGILNGIDYDQWNPQKDPHIAEHYSVNSIEKKQANKLDLQGMVDLPRYEKVPLIGIISRLADQKGLDLIADIIEDLCAERIQLILLGTGDDVYHKLFVRIQKEYPRKTSIHLKFDAVLAQKIYAGVDLFLMPSRYEPCGLGQMISLRYGTIPIVRKTGGLADTIRDCDALINGNGFVFEPYSSKILLETIQRALKAYQDPKRWLNLVKRAMQSDFSWDASAKEYVKLYTQVLQKSTTSKV